MLKSLEMHVYTSVTSSVCTDLICINQIKVPVSKSSEWNKKTRTNTQAREKKNSINKSKHVNRDGRLDYADLENGQT